MTGQPLASSWTQRADVQLLCTHFSFRQDQDFGEDDTAWQRRGATLRCASASRLPYLFGCQGTCAHTSTVIPKTPGCWECSSMEGPDSLCLGPDRHENCSLAGPN